MLGVHVLVRRVTENTMSGEKGKQLTSRQKKELQDLTAGAEPKVTGESRGGVKQWTTAKGVQKSLNAAEREALLKKHRHLATPKSGSQSVPSSPSAQSELRLESLPGGVSPTTFAKQLLGQQSPYKPPTGESVRVGAGTPSRVAGNSEGPELTPKNLEATYTGADTQNVPEPSNSEVLAAVKALTAQFSNLIAKEDLKTFKAELKEEVKEEMKAAVRPVRTDVKELTRRVVNLEKSKGGGKGGGKDPLDHAPRRVAFKYFSSETTAAQRLEAMKTFCAKYPGPDPLTYGNSYKGPYPNRVLRDTGYAEFADQDAVREFLASAGKEVTVQGAVVSVGKAKTKFAGQRDWALYTAKDLVTEAVKGQKKKVEVTSEKGLRTVTVNSAVAFEQQKDEARGSFKGDFGHLSLPS